MAHTNINIDNLSSDIIQMWKNKIEPNFYLYGPDEDAILSFLHNILSHIYGKSKSNMTLQLNLTGEVVSDITNTCERIIQFCTLKSFFNTDGFRKVLILQQNNESLHDSIVSILENINQYHVRIIIVSNNMHTLMPILKSNLVTLMISPTIIHHSESLNKNIISLHDQEANNQFDMDNITDFDLCQKIEDISNIMNMTPSSELINLYYSINE
jgi:hypothetical protein